MSLSTIVKERERKRIYRFLRFSFNQTFEMYWTDYGTSYTDGKDIYIQYDMRQHARRPFTEGECRLLRKSHSIHEVGHIEFDQIEDYFNWVENLSSFSKKDWLANEKYPQDWVTFFGNMALDGRMENLCILKDPSYRPYLDFNNYERRFGIRGERAGTCPIIDFREGFGRVFGMPDIDEWHPAAVDLLDEVDHLIRSARFAPTTKACLDYTHELMVAVWPTLLKWLDEKNLDPDMPNHENEQFFSSHTKSAMDSTDGDGDKHAQQVLRDSGIMDEDGNIDLSQAPKQTPPDSLKGIVHEMIRKEEENAQEEQNEMKEDDFKKENQSVDIPTLRGSVEREVVIKPLEEHDLTRYQTHLQSVRHSIIPFSKTLQKLLDGKKDNVRRNQRKGRFDASKAWKASVLKEDTVFTKHLKGTPTKDAVIQVMWDVSGSTFTDHRDERVIDSMRKAAILLAESCQRINLPINMHAFSDFYDENRGTIDDEIYPLISFDRGLKDKNRSLIGGLEPLRANHDPVALSWGYTQLRQRREDIRLLIILSDGLPCFANNEDPSTMTKLVKQAEKDGIETLCLFIGEHRPDTIDQVRTMYPGRSIIANGNLVKEMEKHVKRIIRQYR